MSDEVQEIRASEILAASGDPQGLRKVKRYDFKRPDKFSLEQLRVFQMIHEIIARGFAATASTRAGKSVDVTVHVVDQLTYGEFIESVPELSAFAVVTLRPLRGTIVVQLDGPLATLLADAACGQASHALALTEPDRPFSEVESIVIESVLEDLLPSVREGWRSTVELSPGVEAIETRPRDAMIVPPTEMIILASLAVTIGDEQANINIAFPFLTLEPIIHMLSAQYWYSQVRHETSVPALGTRAGEIPVACELALPTGSIPLAALPGILGGDPLALPDLDRGLAELRAGGVPVARLRFESGQIGLPSLSLEVAEGRSSSVAKSNGAAGEAAGLAARIEPALAELRSEMRDLRVALEEVGQNRDAVIATDATVDSAQARSAHLDSPHDVAVLVSNERPATVAFLLAPLEPQTAALVLGALPADLRDDAVRALTTLESADLALHARVTTFLKRRIQTRRDSTVAGGPQTVAEILNHVPRGVEKSIMERFEAEDRPLFESIARLMFVFEDFVLVDAQAIRKVAERVGAEELALALKGAARDVVSHVLGALDDEQVAAIEEADGGLGRVRRSDVEAAQHDVIEELRRLEEAGEVVVARPDEVVE
ncbi:MAG: FliG C-terminal domain-containing protein [Spirochaetota bacterium]